MKMLHDPEVRRDIESRLANLTPEATRVWGTMTVDQMLWHVNLYLQFALGQGVFEKEKSKIPAPIFRFMLIYMPWPKGSPTHPAAVAKQQYDFEAERSRTVELIEAFVSRPLDGAWPEDPVFGNVTGKFASRLQAKHLNHHLTQFGA
jgi:hypothetical protein